MTLMPPTHAPDPTAPPAVGTQCGGAGFFAARGWVLPGEWPQRRPSVDQPTLALPVHGRAVLSEPARHLFDGWDRYHDVELVGVGGMGRVYRARDPRTGHDVALKFLVDGRRFGAGHREADLQARVDHPGVLPVLDRGERGGYSWFAMPYLEGRTLKAVRRQLDVQRSVRLAAEVARTVEAIHAAGVVHCDLNPSNVLLAGPAEHGRARPYVIDFGIAREMEQPPDSTTGRVVGTPAYMAPEQALCKTRQVGPPTDVYSLGATLYELVSGRRPFSAETCEAIITKAIREEPEPLRKRNADVPASLERVVSRCLEKDPRDRYPTAAALADALEDCLAGH